MQNLMSFGKTNANAVLKPQSGGMTKFMTFTNAMYLAIGIVCILISVWFFQKYVTPATSTTYKANLEHMGAPHSTAGSKTAEIILFSVDWCPHCKTARPEWDAVKSEYDGKVINGYTILFRDVNCTDESEEVEKMMNQFKIEGYPTIKLIKDGQIIEYDAKPTRATLTQFLNTVV